MPLEFVAKMADSAGNGPGGGIAEWTNGIAFYFLGNIYKQVDVAHVAVAVFKAV